MSEKFCGIGKIPKGYKRGTMKDCLEKKQVRYYGLKKVDPKLVEHILTTKGGKPKNRDKLVIELVGKRGTLVRLNRQLADEKDPDVKKVIREQINKVKDEISIMANSVKQIDNIKEAAPAKVKKAKKLIDHAKNEDIINNLIKDIASNKTKSDTKTATQLKLLEKQLKTSKAITSKTKKAIDFSGKEKRLNYLLEDLNYSKKRSSAIDLDHLKLLESRVKKSKVKNSKSKEVLNKMESNIANIKVIDKDLEKMIQEQIKNLVNEVQILKEPPKITKVKDLTVSKTLKEYNILKKKWETARDIYDKLDNKKKALPKDQRIQYYRKHVEKAHNKYEQLSKELDDLDEKVVEESFRIKKEITANQSIHFLSTILKNAANIQQEGIDLIEAKLQSASVPFIQEEIKKFEKIKNKNEHEEQLLQLFKKGLLFLKNEAEAERIREHEYKQQESDEDSENSEEDD